LLSPAGSSNNDNWEGVFDNRSTIVDQVGVPFLQKSAQHSKKQGDAFKTDPVSAKIRGKTVNAPIVDVDVEVRFGSAYAGKAVADTLNFTSMPTSAQNLARVRVPEFSPELMSGLNSLYELKDLSDSLARIPVHFLWAAYRGKLRVAKREAIEWVAQMRKSYRQNPARILKDLVGLDLEWKFGWKPLIKDVQTVSSVLGRVDHRMERLLTKPFTVRGKAVQDKVETFQVTHPATAFATQRTTTTRKSTCTDVVGLYRRLKPGVLPNIDRMKLSFIRESLGLSLDATDVWEAVPYSFVVDWFYPVQDFLEQMRSVKPNSEWFENMGSWSSVKREVRCDATSIYMPIEVSNCESRLTNNSASYSGVYTDYQRANSAGVPAGTKLFIPNFQLPNMKQWWTGVELALQRMVK
jgi:hypothetical protein